MGQLKPFPEGSHEKLKAALHAARTKAQYQRDSACGCGKPWA